MKALLVSTYDQGFQSVGAGVAAAHLLEAGIDVSVVDLSMTPFPKPEELKGTDFIGFYAPMYHALPRAFRFIKYVKSNSLWPKIFFFGLHADLCREHILSHYGDYVLSMNWEDEITDLAHSICNKKNIQESWVDTKVPPFKEQIKFLPPARHYLRPLSDYNKLIDNGAHLLVGNAETTRGCKFLCTHCPYARVFNGKSITIPKEIVLEDIENLVRMGARHICFIDPDFLSDPKHSLEVVQQMHDYFPFLNYSFTAQIGNYKRHHKYVKELASMGLRFVTTAFEFTHNSVLSSLNRKHEVSDIEWALTFLRDLGIYVKPTFIIINPWMGIPDIMNLLDFIEKHELIDNVEPVQYKIRLLLFHNSTLLSDPELQPLLVSQNEYYTQWKHKDPEVEVLYEGLRSTVDRCIEANSSPKEVFYAVKRQVANHLTSKKDVSIPNGVGISGGGDCPRFDAANFCCTEPTEDGPMQEIKDLV